MAEVLGARPGPPHAGVERRVTNKNVVVVVVAHVLRYQAGPRLRKKEDAAALLAPRAHAKATTDVQRGSRLVPVVEGEEGRSCVGGARGRGAVVAGPAVDEVQPVDLAVRRQGSRQCVVEGIGEGHGHDHGVLSLEGGLAGVVSLLRPFPQRGEAAEVIGTTGDNVLSRRRPLVGVLPDVGGGGGRRWLCSLAAQADE